MLRIRLTRKFAERLNGIDLSGLHVGDVIDVSGSTAAMLLAEGWAELDNQKIASDLPLPLNRSPIQST